MLDENRFQPREFLEKFDGAGRGSSSGKEKPGLEWKNRSGGYHLYEARTSDDQFERSFENFLKRGNLPQIPADHDPSEIEPQRPKVIDIALSASKSPTLIGTLGHVLYQTANAPWMAVVQLGMGITSLYNELREKHFPPKKVSETQDIKAHVSDGSWKGFALDVVRSPALQRIFEGAFYGTSALAIISYGSYYLGAIFATGAIASLANSYYMNQDVNYWDNKQLPTVVHSFFNITSKLPNFCRNLLSNPGFWACVADSMIAVQRIIEQGQYAAAVANPFILTCIGTGIVLCSFGFAQAIRSAWSSSKDSLLLLGDKSVATAVAGFGALSFGIGNMLLQNYAIGAALLLWAAQSFLMAARIEKVEQQSSKDIGK